MINFRHFMTVDFLPNTNQFKTYLNVADQANQFKIPSPDVSNRAGKSYRNYINELGHNDTFGDHDVTHLFTGTDPNTSLGEGLNTAMAKKVSQASKGNFEVDEITLTNAEDVDSLYDLPAESKEAHMYEAMMALPTQKFEPLVKPFINYQAQYREAIAKHIRQDGMGLNRLEELPLVNEATGQRRLLQIAEAPNVTNAKVGLIEEALQTLHVPQLRTYIDTLKTINHNPDDYMPTHRYKA
jgi:hypothetical protein